MLAICTYQKWSQFIYPVDALSKMVEKTITPIAMKNA
jgi:hypothetical protein